MQDALVVRGLTRTYGDRAAIKDLDLTVKVGDVYGFLGPNGAGKTTAMRCMLGLIRRDAGEIAIFGKNDLVAAHADIGAIIETPVFHGWLSGRENLRLSAAYANIPRDRVPAAVDSVLDRVGLIERGSDRAGTYSLGMKQRLAIARALLSEPKLMFLDEPTNGLDPRGVSELREFIRSLARNDGITVFISSHQLTEVEQICNRVGIIHTGRLRAEGTVRELLSGDTPMYEVTAVDADALRAHCASRADVQLLPGEGNPVRVRLTDIDPAAFNASLVHADLSIVGLIPMKRNLEDVFLEVTT